MSIEGKFRIVEHSDFFIVQEYKLFTEDTGFFWWRKITFEYNWSTKSEGPYLMPIFFKSFAEAKKYIDDYNKYPIYHEID